MRAKCLSGIIRKISCELKVAARWLPSDCAVLVRNLEDMLGQPDNRIAERLNGVYLRNTRVDVQTAGDWLLASLMERKNRKGTSLNARLMLELLCSLTTTEEETVFRDILVHAEQWLVGEGCDSCLRNVLRATGSVVDQTPYPYIYWEFDDTVRSISVAGAAYLWSIEPHGTEMTIGKVIEKLGEHDFMVLNSSEKNITIRVIDPEMREDFIIPTIYFSSLKTVIDGFYYHVRSRILSDSSIGLRLWIESRREGVLDWDTFLLSLFCDLAFLIGPSHRLGNCVIHLRMWMMSGRMYLPILNFIK